LTHSPPPSLLEPAVQSHEKAAAFDPRLAPPDWLGDSARLAIAFPPVRIVAASPAMLALFEVNDTNALEARLLRGEGPSARRLRHLAATLPVGEPARLEGMRFVVERRRINVNLRCARVPAPTGATWLLASIPALGAASAAPPPAADGRDAAPPEEPPAPDVGGPPPLNSRFLWTVDEDSRFGAAHPALAAAVGANGPHRGESVEALLGRAELDGGGELVRALATRQTFSGIAVGWPLPSSDRRRLVTLSAAPLFGRRREFLGYRGFGVLGEEMEAAAASNRADLAPSLAEDDQPPEIAGIEPAGAPAADEPHAEAQAPESAAEPLEMDFVPAAADAPEAVSSPEASLEADGSESAPALPEAGETDTAPTDVSEPDFAGLPSAGGAETGPAERTAEIYVLRQPALPPASNIVPIRPGALDGLSSREPPHGFPAESVELTRNERDAFREIARALVGRTPAARDESAGERGELGIVAPAEPPAGREGEPAGAGGADNEEVRRNAGAVLDRLPIGVLIVRDARPLFANQTLLDLIGYPDFAEFEAANGLAAMFRDRDPQRMAAEDAGSVAIVRADGQILFVDGRAQAIAWEGAPATLIALRRSPEAELQARFGAEEREAPMRNGSASDLQAMLDRATDGAVALDAAGRILSLNEPAERLFGYHQNEIAGESVLMLLAPQSHPETIARLEALSRTGEAEAAFRPLQAVGRDRGGGSIPLALTLARIGPNEAPHFCALVRDLTREREAERRLIAARDAAEAASAAKTDFLAQVSHEIRTPLHAILGFAEVMMEERFGPVGNERYKDYLKDIHASGSHVTSLADDLLDLSKIEAGKLELAFAAVDANSVIRECVSLMQPQAARERVIMRVSLHDRLPRVMVDERSLKQIMLNLMSNAVKFNEPGGQVIVSTAVDAAGQAVIRVRDTGVGMSESEVGLALAPFGQVGKAGAKGGAGLGLPLTKALVEANKAEFSIKSRREQGTLIEIAFPNIQAAQ
jgi:PAS domain S-box-containing protein